MAGIFGQEDRNALVVCAFLPCLIEATNRLAPDFRLMHSPLGGSGFTHTSVTEKTKCHYLRGSSWVF